jgi:Transglycosylase SLT domain
MAPRVFSEADFINNSPDEIPRSVQGPRVFSESDFAAPNEAPSFTSNPIGYFAGTSNWGLENVIPNLTSSDWWLTSPDGKKYTAGEAIAGPGLSLLDALTLGTGDEMVAAGNAGIDAIVGGPGYDARLAQTREVQKNFSEASPTIDTALKIGGALKLPIGSSLQSTDSVLRGTAKLASEGAAYGAAYGFGEGEGGLQNRLGKAKQDAQAGALVSGALGAPLLGLGKGISYVTEKAPQWSEKLLNRSAGAKPSDFVKSAKQQEEVLQKTGQTSLALSLKKAREEGVFANAADEEIVYKNIIGKQKEIGSEIDTIIKRADNVKGNIKVYPKFENAEKYIKSQIPADEVPSALKELEKYKTALREQGDGSLSFLQEQKIILGDKVYPEGYAVREGLDNAIRKDLRQTIEKVTASALPNQAGAIRSLNRRWGALDEVRPIVRREMSKDMAASQPQSWKDFLRTSGGYGVPLIGGTIASAATGDPKWLGLGAAYAGGSHFLGSPGGAAKVGEFLQKLSAKPIKATELAKGPKTPTNLYRIPQVLGSVNSSKQKEISSQDVTKQLLSELERNEGSKGTTNIKKQNVSYLINQQPPLVQAVISAESAGNPSAKSKAGALGLMQVMPANLKKLGIDDGLNPEQNIKAGIAILSEELERYGDERLALAAYNAGSPKVNAAIRKAGGRRDWYSIAPYLPEETRAYVPKVMAKYSKLATA